MSIMLGSVARSKAVVSQMPAARLVQGFEVLVITLLPAFTALLLWLVGGERLADMQWDSPDGFVSVFVIDGAEGVHQMNTSTGSAHRPVAVLIDREGAI